MKVTKLNQRRRQFLKYTALTPLGLFGINHELQADTILNNSNVIPKGTTILFQGDSITDAKRDRAGYYANDMRGMGTSYVYQIVAEIQAHHPADQIKCYNRGISGNKVYQLAARWEEDCIQIQPQVLSILIGVNDFWHTLNSGYTGTPEIFNNDLRALLKRTQDQIPDIKILLGEPFAVTGGSAITSEWKDFPPYQRIIKEIATDFNASFVPYQRVFDEALEKAPASHWCPDGVHPSIAGAFLMKEAWLEAFHKLL